MRNYTNINLPWGTQITHKSFIGVGELKEYGV